MEFHYHRTGPSPELATIEQAIAQLDPAVLVDADDFARVRISTVLDEYALLDCLWRAGVQVAMGELERQPSVCCGGCGG